MATLPWLYTIQYLVQFSIDWIRLKHFREGKVKPFSRLGLTLDHKKPANLRRGFAGFNAVGSGPHTINYSSVSIKP